jgi:phosphoglycolate phosphatase
MRVLLFDIDGTMLSSGGAGQAAMEAALEEVFQVTAPTDGIPVAGRTDFGITTDMFKFHGIEKDEHNWSRFVTSYLQQLPRELAAREGLILPGVVDLLEQLANHDGLTLGLLTGNLQRGAEIKLQHFGLAHHFPFGGFGDVHHHRDDVARAAHAEACRHLNRSQLDDVWVLGDTPADVQCGRAIGARVVAVSTGHYSFDELKQTNPDHLFEDFSEVGEVLRILTT